MRGAAPFDTAVSRIAIVMDLDIVQWPAMIVTIIASWFVGSRSRSRRKLGFWIFILSNALWIVWGVHARAYALITLQVCLAFMNVRGQSRNESADA